MITVLILAAGEQSRWGDNGTPKQLVAIGHECLLDRLVRQVHTHFGVDPVIVTHDPRLALSRRSFLPERRGSTCETLYHTHPIWNVRTIVLLGDVVFSDEAVLKIGLCRNLLTVFGRRELRNRLAGWYYEIFGMSWDAEMSPRVMDTLAQAVAYGITLDDPNKAKLRTFYEMYCGLTLGEYQHEDEIFYPIEDWTEDIDTPEDYEQFKAMIVKRGWI